MINILQDFHILQIFCNKYEKRGKYLPILHETNVQYLTFPYLILKLGIKN